MPVPILKLPFLALKVVIACGEDTELLVLSVCSRRADRAVKVCERKPSIFNAHSKEIKRFNDLEKFQLLLPETDIDMKQKLGKRSDLTIVVSDVLALSFCVGKLLRFKLNIDRLSNIDQYKGYINYLKVDGTCIPFIFSNNRLFGFWTERVDGLQFLVKYFEKNFRLEDCNFEFKDSVPDMKPLVCYLNTLPKRTENSVGNGVGVEIVSVERDATLSHSDYKYLLETVTHDFESHLKTSKDFKFVGQIAPQRLFLFKAPWFNLECLLRCKSEYVQVYDSEFTNQQLRGFVERWSIGELSHFKYVRVHLKEDLNFNIILKDINLRVFPMYIDESIWAPQQHPQMIQSETGGRVQLSGHFKVFIFDKVW
ncbi:hypothetical protein CAEBREN_25440 [Caenorhabditis brenneri]|uniref:Sdz-33 F-box domain-containing protein n=1 Tax=Caenorhabditis brenneri TaxID=135651 RepID=G0PKL3_CAEBE|nr:hypothetical protein CAEBREN_25440 [Caenorhabditis brenneri]